MTTGDMTTIDVTATRMLPFAPARVAAYAMDWRHDHEWTQGIRRAELTRAADGTAADSGGAGDGGFGPGGFGPGGFGLGGFGLGAEVTRTAYYLGRRIDYDLRVVGHEPPAVLDMRSVAGPFPMHVTYRFDPEGTGTRASIRVRGGPRRFARLVGPVMSRMVGANLAKDLRDLERQLAARG